MKQSKRAVIVAFFGNLIIAIFKLIAALLSGSSSMLAESYHSFSDTVNQICLFIGLRRSRKKPDVQHPFGYGMEQFFWSFIVAMLLFGIAGFLSIRHGYIKLFNPHPLQHIGLIYAALAVALVLDGYSFSIAYKSIRNFMKKEKFKTIFQAIKHSKDAVVLTVFFEDSMALMGITIAVIGITLTQITGNLIFDSIASILIGIMLLVFAFVLAYEVKKLLIGESVTLRKRNQIRKIVNSFKEVKKIIRLHTMHMAAEDVLIVLEVNFQDDIKVDDLEKVINRICAELKPLFHKTKIIIEAEDK